MTATLCPGAHDGSTAGKLTLSAVGKACNGRARSQVVIVAACLPERG
jgi:hypothetical protein